MAQRSEKKRRPLRLWQAMLALQLATLVPGLVVEGFIFSRWYQAARNGQLNERSEVAQSVSRTVQTYVLGVRHQAEAVGTAMLGVKPGDAANAMLDTIGRQSESVGFLHWVSPEGTILASSIPAAVGTSVAGHSYFQALKAGKPWVASDLLMTPGAKAPAFVVACGVMDGGRLRGITVAEIEVVELRQILSAKQVLGEVVVYDSKGVLLFQYPGTIDLATVSRINQDPLLASALQGQTAVGESLSLADGSRQLAARVPVPGLGWVAGANRPTREVVSPMVRSFVTVLGLMTLVVVGSAAVAVVISRRVVGDVRRLQEHAQALGRGDLDHPVRIDGISELGELALAYQEMAARRKEVEGALRGTTEELARSNQDLQQFAYVASHDLQEPLRMVKGFMLLLEHQYGGKLDAKADQFIHFAVDGAERMSRLISELLAYSRVGTEGKEFSDVDCNVVFRQAMENLQALVRDSGAVVQSDPLPVVKGDPTQLAQVFQNLLANAMKFRDERPPAVHVGARESGAQWELSVRDNGIGISPAQAGRLFMMFQRLHDHSKYPGTGIGLATCKKIVERHGGKIWVQSQPGEGSTFFFTIPKAAS
jgi:signal transduction histidine kinase